MNPQPLDLGEIKKRIEECFNQLENMFEYGGDESEEGELYPGVPDWEKAKRKIYNFFEQHLKSAVDGLLEEIENQSYHRNEEDWGNLESDYVINLEDVRFLIRKWFPDVVEEKEE